MYSQKWNCSASLFPKQIIMLCLPISTFICERFIYSQDQSAYFAAAKYLNSSQIHECRNLERGRADSFLEINKSVFLYSAVRGD